MLCARCGTDNPEAAKFCIECASPLKTRCSQCGGENPPQAKFCAQCAAPLTASAAGPSSLPPVSERTTTVEAPPEPEGERKMLSALFADIKGSTALMEDLDPEEARAIIDPALRHMIDAVHRYQGYVVQSTGDGIFALFGAPIAYEDHPQRALYAALQMRDALREYGAKLAAQAGPALEARIGVNTGEVVVRQIETSGRTEYTPIGHTANLAARMETAAPAGSIAISEQTRKLVEGYFELRPLGATSVKGVSEAVGIYEVIGAGPLRTHFELAARRGLTRFVGREHELAQMMRGLEQARAGYGKVVATVGEAGAGKSRLTHEFKQLAQGHFKVLEAYSVSHGKASTWLPVVELLKSYFAIIEDDDERGRSEKTRAKVRALDPTLEDILPYIESLLGIREAAAGLRAMDAQIKRQRTLEALRRLFIRESLNQPLLIIFEDLHWIDEYTQELLDLMVESVATAALLLLVNYRPEYSHQWGNKTYCIQLHVNPLESERRAEMLTALIGDDAGLDSLKRLIAGRTQGNPFFIEEIVQAMFEQGVLMRNGVVRLAKAVDEVKIPSTVQGILASRIDRLPAAEKDLLQSLAVLGKDFALPLARAVTTQSDDQLRRLLARLGAGEFVYEQPAFPDVEYTFKHALTQEVAYNSMLIERRRRLHLQAAEAIAAVYGERLDRHYDELMRHNERGGDIRKALHFMHLALGRAGELSAYGEMLHYLNHGLDVIGALPEPERSGWELGCRIGLMYAVGYLKGWGAEEVGAAGRRAQELCQQMGIEAPMMQALPILRLFHLDQGEIHRAAELAHEHLALARRLGDRFQEGSAHAGLAETMTYLGEHASSRDHNQKAIAFCTAELSLLEQAEAKKEAAPAAPTASALRMLRSVCALNAIHPLWFLGFPDQARQRGAEALVLAQESDAHVLVVTLLVSGWMHLRCGEADAVRERIDRVLVVTNQYGLNPNWKLGATILRARMLILEGHAQEAIAILRDIALPARVPLIAASARITRAAAYAAAGQAEASLDAINDALDFQIKRESRENDAEVHCFRGEILLIQPQPDRREAEGCFRS
ncbi:MAG TPA: adenylate/guanylate cyclase domain-containing protein, partial [Candidatus Binataceae bacterium]|nr:adenylate/guanylate cyclase domain-containing protein [Candidatus Binataceae bacterium]